MSDISKALNRIADGIGALTRALGSRESVVEVEQTLLDAKNQNSPVKIDAPKGSTHALENLPKAAVLLAEGAVLKGVGGRQSCPVFYVKERPHLAKSADLIGVQKKEALLVKLARRLER